MINLTPKQQWILTKIRDYRLARGYSPTMQELADELGVTKVTIFERVQSLVKKGALKRDPNKARSLELTSSALLPDESSNTRLPLVGAIAAGAPIEAVEERQFVDLEEIFGNTRKRRSDDTFVLKVRGDSMIEEHIRDGDYVVCQRTDTARNGQTVVALLDNGEATLKKFYRESGGIRLQPANEKYEPIYLHDVMIQGVVVGVIRTY